MDKVNLRTVFEKTGRTVYISHLDLMRTMQRAIKRSGIPIWYTQGFNPHIYLMFPLALSLGIESRAEIMDFSIVEDVPLNEIKDKLNSSLPEGLKIISINQQEHTNKDISFAEYKVRLCSDIGADRLLSLFNDFLSKDAIEVEKHSKRKGIVALDIKPYIQVNNIEADNETLSYELILPAGINLNINANVVIDAFVSCFDVNLSKISIERTKIMLENYDIFM